MKTFTAAQLRAARALLNISAAELARATKLGVTTIRRAEDPEKAVSMTVVNAERITSYFEEAGVVFVDDQSGGRGVRFKLKG